MEVIDIDNDGIYEMTYMHHLVPEGVDPSQLFLTIYFKNEKYQLSGILPINPKEIENVAYLKTPSDNFDQLPGNVIEYCYQKWDRFIKEFQDNLITVQ